MPFQYEYAIGWHRNNNCHSSLQQPADSCKLATIFRLEYLHNPLYNITIWKCFPPILKVRIQQQPVNHPLCLAQQYQYIKSDKCGHKQLGYLPHRFGSDLKSMTAHYVLPSFKGLLPADGIHPKQQHIHTRHNLC